MGEMKVCKAWLFFIPKKVISHFGKHMANKKPSLASREATRKREKKIFFLDKASGRW